MKNYEKSEIIVYKHILYSLVVGCSHGRAYEYFTDSILHSHTYKAFKCESWTELKNGHCSSSSTSAVYMGDEVAAKYVKY